MVEGEINLRKVAAFIRPLFFEWLLVLMVGAGAAILHDLDGWTAHFTTTHLLTEISITFLLAGVLAVPAGLFFGLIWVGLRLTCRKSFADMAGPALSTGFALVILFLVFLKLGWTWSHDVGVVIRWPHFNYVFLACAVGVGGFAVFRLVKRRTTLVAISEKLRSPARRALVSLLPAAAVMSFFGGVSWRSFAPRRERASVSPPKKPNILLITFDALSASDMSVYGYSFPTTPNIARFAGAGIIFENFYSASTWTKPAVSSVMSGVSVARHGIGWFDQFLPREFAENSLPARLKRDGYTTSAIVSNVVAHPEELGLDKAFSRITPPQWQDAWPVSWVYHIGGSALPRRIYDAWSRLSMFGNRLRGRLSAPIHVAEPASTFEMAKTFVAETKGPWFLWVHVLAPHFFYGAPEPFRGRFLVGKEFLSWNDFLSRPELQYCQPYENKLQPEFDKIRLRYDEFLAYADERFGDFLQWADGSGALANTVVAVSADHGETFRNGFWGHGGPMPQDVIHIPFILRLPTGEGAGTRVQTVAGSTDICPTLLALAGVKAGDYYDGVSLMPLWQGGSLTRQGQFVCQLSQMVGDPSFTFYALIDGSMKFVVDGVGRVSLFDLTADLHAEHDIAAQHPDLVQRYRNRIDEELKRGRAGAKA